MTVSHKHAPWVTPGPVGGGGCVALGQVPRRVLCRLQAARSQLATLREGVRAAAASNDGFETAAEAVRQASSDADLRVADIIERCRCVSLRAASFRLASPCVASAPRCSSDYAPA